MAIMLIVSYKKKNLLALPLKEFFHIRKSTVKRFYPVVLPVVFNESLWAVASMALNMVYGRLGTGNYSAMTVKNTIENLAFTFFIGLSSADSVMVGKSIGAGDFKRGFTDARRFGLLSPALAVLLGVVLVLLRVPLTNLFTLSDEVKVTAQYLMIVNACIYPLRMFNHMNIVGTFRAGGDTKASLLMDAGSIWCLSVPLVALAFHIFFGYRVIGRENIPEGGCVVCPNHVQLSDPPFAAVALGGKTPIRLMAKKELFRKKIFAWLIAALGAFPIDREGADITAIKTALGSVRAGQKLIIFPQGTRHAAEGETKKGAAMLAVKTRAPILPMYITEGKRFRCRATVVIGKPFTPDPKQKDYGLIADDILRRIYALKEQV